MSHPAHVYNTLEQYLESRTQTPRSIRRAKRRWKLHVEKHGNVPMIEKCPMCSGLYFREDIKHGGWKISKEKVKFDFE